MKKRWDKHDISLLMGDFQLFPSPITGGYILSKEGTGFLAETTIDVHLQQYITRLLRRSRTNKAAVVALDPSTGRIVALADYTKSHGGEQNNLCLQADVPAASLFKVISAAAAIEAREFQIDQPMFFNGGRHTLYKSQLKQVKNRYTRKTDLKKAFSLSNNPVFGKIGIYDLGGPLMKDYAERFMFNSAIPFDLPIGVSHIDMPNDQFGLAELASGFNKETKLSPIHAALIVSAVVNNGIMMEPWLVKNVRDETGDFVYRARIKSLSKPITENTAEQLKVLMGNTVRYGTCRTAFRPLVTKKAFQEIELGAKTGTINDPLDRYKFDWITTYAVPKKGRNPICIAILAVHGEKLGIRAKDLARYILDYHFTS
jgi:cell division protein FtsI/penicillin-binding protein 2